MSKEKVIVNSAPACIGGRLISENVEAFNATVIENKIDDFKKIPYALVCAEQDAILEANVASDIAGYDKFLFRMTELAYASIIGLDIYGVQVLSGPTGMIFALSRSYAGNTTAPGVVNVNNSKIFILASGTHFATKNGDINGVSSGATGKVVIAQGGMVLVKVVTGTFTVGETVNDGSGHTTTLNFIDENYIAYKHVFKNYSDFTTTADAEIADRTTTNQVILNIKKVTAEALPHKIRVEFTNELRQDLRAQHGEDARELLVGIAANQFAQEINAVLLTYMKSSAALGGTITWNWSSALGISEKQKMDSLIATISRQAASIGKTTLMGMGNFIVTDLITYASLEIAGNITKDTGSFDPSQSAYGGMLLNRMRVYVDMYESATVVYVGYKDFSGRPESQWRAGYYYCPYVPVEYRDVVSYETAQPAMVFQTRYAVVANPFGAQLFYRKIIVSNLPL
jgi:hypothetical protein